MPAHLRVLPGLGLCLVYALLTALMMEPLIDFAALGSATYGGDSRLLVWTLAWDAHAVSNGLSLFAANIFYPARDAMQYAEHHLGIALLTLPVYLATGNPVLAYWLAWLLSFPANALAMHLIGWRLTRSHVSAFVGAVVFTFTFFRMLHAHGHIQLLWTAWLPLSLWALERWMRDPSVPRIALVWALVFVQCLVSGYLAVMTLLAHAVLFAVLLVSGRSRFTSDHAVQVVMAAAAGTAALWPLLVPYQTLTGASIAEAASLSAEWSSYLVPPQNTWMGRWLARQDIVAGPGIYGEHALFLGWIALGLAVVGLVDFSRRSGAGGRMPPFLWGVALIGVLGLALSFGPAASGVAPFDLARHLPGVSLFRAPARFALLVVFAVAALASLGAAAILRLRGGRAVIALCVPLMLLEWRVVDFPGGKPAALPLPAAYERLEGLPPGAIVSLPDYTGTDQWFREADYLLFSTWHWRPIANGYGRSEPAGFRLLMETLRTFPSDEAIEALRRHRVRYVFWDATRADGSSESIRLRAGGLAGLRLLETIEGITIFEVLNQ